MIELRTRTWDDQDQISCPTVEVCQLTLGLSKSFSLIYPDKIVVARIKWKGEAK